MVHKHTFSKLSTLLIIQILLLFTITSCTKIKKNFQKYNFGVLISPTYSTKINSFINTPMFSQNEGEVFLIINKSKSKENDIVYTIESLESFQKKETPQTHTVAWDQLILFEELEEAQKFKQYYKPFIGVFAHTPHPIQIRSRATPNSKRTGVISLPDKQVYQTIKIINTLQKLANSKSPNSIDIIPQSVWAYIQGPNSNNKIVRGWALISHQWDVEYTKLNPQNITGLSSILETMFIFPIEQNKVITYPQTLLIPNETITLLKDRALSVPIKSYPPFGLSLQNKHTQNPPPLGSSNTLTLSNTNFLYDFLIINEIGRQTIPLTKIFPLSDKKSVYAAASMEILWTTNNKTIQDITITSDNALNNTPPQIKTKYIPIATSEIANKNIQTEQYQKRIFALLSKNSIWNSSLFGQITIVGGATSRTILWQMPQKAIPKTLQDFFSESRTLKATISAKYVPTGILKQFADAIISLETPQHPIILFALKTFSDRQFNLQMLPSNTPIKYRNIDATPVGPVMSFSKR